MNGFVVGWMEGDSAERDDWEKEAFWGQEEALCKGYAHKSTRTNPAKTLSNSGYID